MAGRRADIGIAQVKRRGFTFDLICLAHRVADERSHPSNAVVVPLHFAETRTGLGRGGTISGLRKTNVGR